MKRFLPLALYLMISGLARAQKVDSIYFHLYTDSLKKGTHNYINVDGKLNNGRWKPLTSKEISFTCPDAEFEGNDLVIPVDFKPEKVVVTAVLKSDPSIRKEVTIWIKKKTDDEILPTREEIMQGMQKRKGKN